MIGEAIVAIGLLLPILFIAGIGVMSGVRVIQQYEAGVHFRLGRVIGVREPGVTWIVPMGVDRIVKVTTQIVTLPIPSQKIITRDNVSIDVAAVAYYRVTDPVKAVVSIQDLVSAVGQIAQTTVRNTIGQFSLDQILSETVIINKKLKEIIDVQTEMWGAVVSLVELKDITLPESMQRAMAKEAEAEREKRAKIIAAEGEFLAAERLGASCRRDGGSPDRASAAQSADPHRDLGGKKFHHHFPQPVFHCASRHQALRGGRDCWRHGQALTGLTSV